MMYDRLATFAENTDIGGLTANSQSVVGDVIDLTGGRFSRQGQSVAQNTDLGGGLAVKWFLEWEDWPTNNNSASFVTIELVTASNSGLSASINRLVGKRISTAANTAPSDFRGTFTLPSGVVYGRYLGIVAYSGVTWAAAETGDVNSWLLAEPHTSQIIYEEGRNWAVGL